MDREGPTREQEIPYAFPGRMPIADATERVETIESGEHSGIVVTIAGRLMLLRRQGKVVFGDLRDSSGAVQLFANANVTERFEEFPELSLGDWIGVSGEIMRTRRGELSVEVKSWELLAQAKRGFGDKWRGISDPDIRYRQRYVDVWANPEVRTIFLRRSKIVAETRRYL
ncbi:MAG: OB-fold nucleic acid binding domain-containing protein, partial [Acidimicrobiales bacterium]